MLVKERIDPVGHVITAVKVTCQRLKAAGRVIDAILVGFGAREAPEAVLLLPVVFEKERTVACRRVTIAPYVGREGQFTDGDIEVAFGVLIEARRPRWQCCRGRP